MRALAERQGFEPWTRSRVHGLAIRSVTTPAPLRFALANLSFFPFIVKCFTGIFHARMVNTP